MSLHGLHGEPPSFSRQLHLFCYEKKDLMFVYKNQPATNVYKPANVQAISLVLTLELNPIHLYAATSPKAKEISSAKK